MKVARQPQKRPAAAAMLAQRPNDARVRGAGPARKTFLRPKACKAPHPLQPIVRPRHVPTGAGPGTLQRLEFVGFCSSHAVAIQEANLGDDLRMGLRHGHKGQDQTLSIAVAELRRVARTDDVPPADVQSPLSFLVGDRERVGTAARAVVYPTSRHEKTPLRRREESPAAMLAQRPNDARVRGAGPPRKPFLRPKACKAPHTDC